MTFVSPYCTVEGCGRFTEGNTNQCATHNALDRKNARQIAKPIPDKEPIAKQSDKRKKENLQYVLEARKFLVGKFCKVCEHNGVTGTPATQVHHMAGKENELLLIKKWWLPVCGSCHAFITEDSAWAIENKFSLPRHTKKTQLK